MLWDLTKDAVQRSQSIKCIAKLNEDHEILIRQIKVCLFTDESHNALKATSWKENSQPLMKRRRIPIFSCRKVLLISGKEDEIARGEPACQPIYQNPRLRLHYSWLIWELNRSNSQRRKKREYSFPQDSDPSVQNPY